MPTRKLGFSALLTALYSRLTTHANTSSYTFRNHMDRNQSMPYHVLGKSMGIESLSYTTRDTEAEDIVVQIDSWLDETSGLGDKACADMQNNIIQAVTSSALSITGYDFISVKLDYADIIADSTDPTEKTKHGILRFRFEISPSS